jgi:hypothetical protein
MKDASPAAVRQLYQSGRGVYGMKALDGGRITGRMAVAAAFALRFPGALQPRDLRRPHLRGRA